MRARFPSINYDYSFAYEFPTHFPHHARHSGPPDDEMPKVEDVVPYAATRRLLDIIRLPDTLLQQLGNDDEQAANVEVVNEEVNVAQPMAQHGAASNVAHDDNYRRQPPADTRSGS